MSNDVVTYSGGAAVPYVEPSDGVITNAPFSGEVTISKEDSFAIDQFSRVALGHGLDRNDAKAAAREYYTRLMREQNRQDEQHRKEIRSQMQREWGGLYGANVKRIRAFVDSLPLSLQDVIWEGRTTDGVLGLNDPSVLRWLLRLSQPAGSYQGSGGNAEIQQIEQIMRKDRQRYNRDERMQERYRELLSQRG